MIELGNPEADIFVPDGMPLPEGLRRVTHLGVVAHQDDLEFMAFPAIAECYDHTGGSWFGGVVCTDGRGSVREGPYAEVSADELRDIRREEQRKAASIGHYAVVAQLDYPSSAVKGLPDPRLVRDIENLLRLTSPSVLLAHNPADKHPTHLGVLAATVAAVKALPKDERPARFLGCEVWRGLDWMDDNEKVALDSSGHGDLAEALARVFDSQIAGGKRYDAAVAGRRAANATFFNPHHADPAESLTYAMDLSPLLDDEGPSPAALALGAIDRFREDVRSKLEAVGLV